MGGSGISWTICKSFAPCSRQITTPVPQHFISTGRMMFLSPNQQRQNTEWNKLTGNSSSERNSLIAIACTTTLYVTSKITSHKFIVLLTGWFHDQLNVTPADNDTTSWNNRIPHWQAVDTTQRLSLNAHSLKLRMMSDWWNCLHGTAHHTCLHRINSSYPWQVA